MKQSFSKALTAVGVLFYSAGIAAFLAAHLYATYLAYHYVLAWRARGVIFWTFMTFLVPALSTAYWLFIHWLESGVLWNWLTLACVAGLAGLITGALCELARRAAA